MKRCWKITMTTILVLAGILFIGVLLGILFPKADHQKVGQGLAGVVLAIAFGLAVKGSIGKKKPKDP